MVVLLQNYEKDEQRRGRRIERKSWTVSWRVVGERKKRKLVVVATVLVVAAIEARRLCGCRRACEMAVVRRQWRQW